MAVSGCSTNLVFLHAPIEELFYSPLAQVLDGNVANGLLPNLQHVGQASHPPVLAPQLPILVTQLIEGRPGDVLLVQVPALNHQHALLGQYLPGQSFLTGAG